MKKNTQKSEMFKESYLKNENRTRAVGDLVQNVVPNNSGDNLKDP